MSRENICILIQDLHFTLNYRSSILRYDARYQRWFNGYDDGWVQKYFYRNPLYTVLKFLKVSLKILPVKLVKYVVRWYLKPLIYQVCHNHCQKQEIQSNKILRDTQRARGECLYAALDIQSGLRRIEQFLRKGRQRRSHDLSKHQSRPKQNASITSRPYTMKSLDLDVFSFYKCCTIEFYDSRVLQTRALLIELILRW